MPSSVGIGLSTSAAPLGPSVWIGYTKLDSFVRAGRVGRSPWRTRSTPPRHFTDELKRQIVELVNTRKAKADAMRKCDLSKSTVGRWVKSINAAGSPHAADNRTPEQNRVIELERENRRLRMEVEVLKQAALIFARK